MKIDHSIIIELKNECNMHCDHCYKGKKEREENIKIESLLKFFDSIDEWRDRSIILTGGETLMYSELLALLKILNDRNFNIRINTNGILLPNFITCFSNIRRLKVQVSLDGFDNDTYSHIRNKDMFDTVIDNTLIAYKNGIDIYFRATLTKDTFRFYEKYIEISHMTGIPLIMRPMIYTGIEQQIPYLMSLEDINAWLADSTKNKCQECLNNSVFENNHVCSLLNKENRFGTIYIKSNGDVFPCQLLMYDKFRISNIYNTNFFDVEQRIEYVKKIYKKYLSNIECKECKKRYFMGNGTCFAACFFEKNNCNLIKEWRGK